MLDTVALVMVLAGAALRGSDRLDRRIGHGAAGNVVHRPVAFARPAHRLGEDVHLGCLQGAIGLRNGSRAEEVALGELREIGGGAGGDAGVVAELHRDFLTGRGSHAQQRAFHGHDIALDALRLGCERSAGSASEEAAPEQQRYDEFVHELSLGASRTFESSVFGPRLGLTAPA